MPTQDPPKGTVARSEQVVKAPVDRVFAAFTTPEDLSRWAWGSLAKNTSASVDLWPGGLYRIETEPQNPDDWPRSPLAMLGRYIEIVPNQRLVYTLHWDASVGYNAPGTVVADEWVRVEFEETAEGTRIVFDHFGIPDDGIAAIEHQKGNQDTLRTLAKMLEEEG